MVRIVQHQVSGEYFAIDYIDQRGKGIMSISNSLTLAYAKRALKEGFDPPGDVQLGREWAIRQPWNWLTNQEVEYRYIIAGEK